MICTPNTCGCAITTTTMTITGSGTPADPWVIDMAGSSAITQLQTDVSNINAALAALPGTYVDVVGDSMTGPLSITATVEAMQIRRTTDGAHIGWYFTDGTRQGFIQAIDASKTFRITADTAYAITLSPGATERMRLLADGSNVLIYKTATNIATTGHEFTATGTVITTRPDSAQCHLLNKTSTGASASGSVFTSFQLAGTQIGTITRNAATSAVLYNTTSDAELKNVIDDLDPELCEYVLGLIMPVMFSWKDDKGNTPIAGYIAQQVAKAWPQSIELGMVTPGYGDITARTYDSHGNETTPEGVWGPWQMSHAILIPILHASLVRTTTKLSYLRAEYDEFKASVEDRLALLEDA